MNNIFISFSMSTKVIDQTVFETLFKQAVDSLGRMLFNESQQELLLSIEELYLYEPSFVKYNHYGRDEYNLSYIRKECCKRVQGYLRNPSFVQEHSDIVEKLMSMFFESSKIPSLEQINKDLEKISKFIFASPKYVEEQIALRKENQCEPFAMLGKNQQLLEKYSIIFNFKGIVENTHSIKLDDGSKLLISMPCPMMKRNVGKPIFLSTIVWNSSFKSEFLNWGLCYEIDQRNEQFPTEFPMEYSTKRADEGISIACIGTADYPIPTHFILRIQSNVQFMDRCGNYSRFDFSLIDGGKTKIEINSIPLPSIFSFISHVELNTSNPDYDSFME